MEQQSENTRERRQHDRFNINLPVEATFHYGGSQRLLRSRSINISAGGVFFPSSFGLNTGTHLGMRIQAPAGSLGDLFAGSLGEDLPVLIRTDCEVVHSIAMEEADGEFRLGVRFSGPMRISPAESGETVRQLLNLDNRKPEAQS